MKKLIMTTVAAFGFAVCAKAADDGVLNKTGFEDYDTLDSFKVNATDTGATEGDQFWTGDGSADFSQTVLKTYAEAAEAPANVPDAFTNAANTTFLSVDTGNAVMYRRAAANPTETIDLSSAGPVFFDADVKFTASESDVVPSEGDKLLVWLKGDETTTNLIVTAGLYNGTSGEYDKTPFIIDGDYSADTWYRLTVKATRVLSGDEENYTTAFNVYIDGKLVTSDGTDLFYSLVQQTDKLATTIAEAGFQGTGALDNVVWTTTDPFPEVEPTTVALTVNVTGEYSSLVYIVGESTTTNEVDGIAASIEAAVDDVVTFVLTVANGYTPAVTGYELQKGEEQVDEFSDVYYPYTFTATVTQAMIDGGLTLTINVTEDGGEEPTPEDTTEINADGKGYVADETGSTYTKAAVEAMVTVVAPNADSLSEEAKTAYDGYFTKNATYNTETKKWEVAVTLDTITLEADVDDAVEAALEAVVGDAETKAVEIPAGFYYKIEHGATVGLTGEPLTGTSTGSVAMPALGEDAGFFKVSVGTTDFAE